jgi:hypothetical protein
VKVSISEVESGVRGFGKREVTWHLMLRLFRRKMVSVVKYFRQNQFQKKLFSRKYFSAFGSHEKIMKSENTTVAGIRQRPVVVAGIRRTCPAGHLRARSDPAGSGHFGRISAGSVAGSGQIRPDSGHFGQIRPGQCQDPIRSGRIPAILARSGQIRPDSSGIRRSCRMWPDSGGIPAVGFRRRHYSSDLMMPDSGAAYFRTTDYCRIRTVIYQMCV